MKFLIFPRFKQKSKQAQTQSVDEKTMSSMSTDNFRKEKNVAL